MLDMYDLWRPTTSDVQVFCGALTLANGTQVQSWVKPRGVTTVTIQGCGGGAGGGGAHGNVAGAARGGGGGGGSSCFTTSTYIASFLPNVLYVICGTGGAGGAGSTANGAASDGAVGIVSRVEFDPRTTNQDIIWQSGNTAPTAGAKGTAATGGAAGSAGGVITASNIPFGGPGNFYCQAGAGGNSGGSQAGAIGGAITILSNGNGICMGAPGGAGTTSADFAGGLITAVASLFLSDIRPQGAAAGSNNGSGGPQLLAPFFSFCGLGGGSSNTGVGGHGGPGAYGAGGGGGGAGTTGGTGGRGGPGIVIITAW